MTSYAIQVIDSYLKSLNVNGATNKKCHGYRTHVR